MINGDEVMPQWQLDGRHVIDASGRSPRVYIRALLDIGSHEFNACVLSHRERLEIIESIGEDAALHAMADVAHEKQQIFDIEHQGRITMRLLRQLAQSGTGQAREQLAGGPL